MAAVTLAELEAAAAERLDPGVFGYFAGGSGDEVTLRENVDAWSRRRLIPRIAVDVSRVSTATEFLGRPVASPVGVAPVAFQGLVDPLGEVATARAAATSEVVFCLSTLANESPRDLAASAPQARRLFQVYAFRDRAITHALVDEAVDSGFEALVLTLDAPRAGNRERDRRTGFAIPSDLRVPSLDAILGPGAAPDIGEVFGLVDAGFDWDDLSRTVEQSPVPVLVKGVMRGEDASEAVARGVGGIVVSNHGGRQLDRVPATLDVLEDVVEAVDGRVPVQIDGGIRRGLDVAIAIALGAEGVLVGRPVLWGLAVEGQAGVERVLEQMRVEFELALALLGCREPSDLRRSHVGRAT